MDESLDNKIELKDRISNFYKKNKLKIYFVFFIILIVSALLIFLKERKAYNNNLIAEKYIKAGIFLNSNEKKRAIEIYDEIILSKNNFYSILSLNTILEKNLITEKNKILSYFDILEKINFSEDTKDLILFKKALYFIEMSDTETGNKLLNHLIDKKSNYKSLAQNVIGE